MIASEYADARARRQLADQRIEDARPCEELRAARGHAGERRHFPDGHIAFDASLTLDRALEVRAFGPPGEAVVFLHPHPCSLIFHELQGLAACCCGYDRSACVRLGANAHTQG